MFKNTDLKFKIERSIYNKRPKKLLNYTESIRKRISAMFVEFTDIFVVDSMLTPICKYARGGRS